MSSAISASTLIALSAGFALFRRFRRTSAAIVATITTPPAAPSIILTPPAAPPVTEEPAPPPTPLPPLPPSPPSPPNVRLVNPFVNAIFSRPISTQPRRRPAPLPRPKRLSRLHPHDTPPTDETTAPRRGAPAPIVEEQLSQEEDPAVSNAAVHASEQTAEQILGQTTERDEEVAALETQLKEEKDNVATEIARHISEIVAVKEQAEQDASRECARRDQEIIDLKEQAKHDATRENARRDQEIVDLRTQFEQARKQAADETTKQLGTLQKQKQEWETVAANRLKENQTKQNEAKEHADVAANELSEKFSELENVKNELTAAKQKLAALGTGAVFEELTTVETELATAKQLNQRYIRDGEALFEVYREVQQARDEKQTKLKTTRNEYHQYVIFASAREQELINERTDAIARENVLLMGWQALQQEHDDLEGKLGKVENEGDGLREKNGDLETSLDMWQALCKDTQEDLKKKEAKCEDLETTNKGLQTENDRLTRRCNALPTDDESMKKKYSDLQDEHTYLLGERQRLENRLCETNKLVTKMTGDLSTAQNDLGRAQAELEDRKRSRVVRSSEELEEVRIELGLSQGELAKADAELEGLKKSKLGAVKAELDELKAVHKVVGNEKEALREHINNLAIRNHGRTKENEGLKKTILELKKTNDEKDAKIRDLELFG